jgi:ABC-type branched-subunit amino acid transport system ATPase component
MAPDENDADNPRPVPVTAGAQEETAITVDDVHVNFGGVKAVNGASLTVQSNEIVSLLGQNGAGKTTLLNCISRSVRHTSGRIEVFGHDIGSLSPHVVTRLGVSRTFQSVALFGSLNALQVGLLGVDFRGRATAAEYALRLPRARRDEGAARESVIEALRLAGFDAPLDRTLGQLSYGQAKLADLARAIAGRPKLLLLDEPAAGLNSRERTVIAEAIERVHHELGVPVLVIEHDMELMKRLSTRTIVMDLGRVIAEGQFDEVLAMPNVRASLLGVLPEASETI